MHSPTSFLRHLQKNPKSRDLVFPKIYRSNNVAVATFSPMAEHKPEEKELSKNDNSFRAEIEKDFEQQTWSNGHLQDSDRWNALASRIVNKMEIAQGVRSCTIP